MYCLRWWIPLFLVPFPKVSPFFLILFLLSFTLHSRPCVYCALILFGLFATSVNWYPELGLGPSPVTMTTSTQEAISPKPEAAPFYPGSILASIDAAPTGSAVPTQTGIVPPAVEQVLSNASNQTASRAKATRGWLHFGGDSFVHFWDPIRPHRQNLTATVPASGTDEKDLASEAASCARGIAASFKLPSALTDSLLWLGLDVERVVVPEKVFVGLGRAGGLGFWINLVPGGGGEGPPAAPIRTFTS